MGTLYHDTGIRTVTTTLSILLLLSVPGLPLLLAFPALRSRLSRPCLLALLPAVILLLLQVDFSIEVPWLLFGSWFGIDGVSRWLLAMAVVLWAAAAILLHGSGGQAVDNRLTVFFLLTMAGNLGAVMATDVAGFFAFSSLMGYGFYGLLVAGGDETARRVGRVYLGFMIVADLVLFEALLIAAANTWDLEFEAVHYGIVQSPISDWYVSMVLAGFALKAGAWPLHFWLPLALRSSRPAVALLLGGVPVAMALLGMLRWLPLGEISFPDLGLGIQIVGLIAAIFATLAGLMQSNPRALLAYAVVVATALFVTILGAGIERPAIGSAIQGEAHLFILYLGLTLAALVPGSLLPDIAKVRLTLHSLRFAGHGAGALLLALSPMMLLVLIRAPNAGDPLFADFGMVSLWPWWTLCTTLLVVRWIYLLPHRQEEAVSVRASVLWAVWGVLLVAAYGTGLLAAVGSVDLMGVIVDVWWPFVLGILIGGNVWWMAAKRKLPSIPTISPGDFWTVLERWFIRGNRWVISMGLQVLPGWRASALAVVGRFLQVRWWQKALDAGEHSLQSWTLSVTLLLLLGVVIALLST
jgi:multicomponent K+:H+ antiporter subunit D